MAKRVLLVEGPDDQHVIWGLMLKHSFPHRFDIEQKGGINNIFKTLPVQAKGSGVAAVGVVIDADVDLKSRWRTLQQQLTALGYETPDDMPMQGLVVEHEFMPRVGAWIMPDNTVEGMLEDFVAYLVPDGDDAFKHASAVLDALPDAVKRYADLHRSKALIHTWLSWQIDPGTPMGQAITKKYLNGDAPVVEPFLRWLERLFAR